MKRILLILTLTCCNILITAQETTVNVALDPGYTNEVYYKLTTNTQTTFTAASWDVAFLRNDNFNLAVRVNDGINIKVFEVANTPSGYNTVDISNQASWIELVNSDTTWEEGAFMQGSATFGFGEYNPANNTVEGTIVFVLEYEDGTFRKLFIESYFSAYTFKYATWDGSSWSTDTTSTVSNTSNSGNIYNYYSLQNNEEVVAEPAENDWDFVFRKYTTFINPPGQNYVVTGALHNPNVTVAQNEETGAANPNGISYLDEMNTIGYDWKSFMGSWNIDSEQKYYVKYEDNTVFRLYFTEFGGSGTGALTFITEDVSDILGIKDVTENVSFGLYPNPTVDKIVTLFYENKTNASNNQVDVYDLNGRKVFAKKVTKDQGLYTKTLDLSSLQSGVYLVTFTSGNKTASKKLIIN